MGFRYDLKGKSSQAQAILDQHDRADELRRSEVKKEAEAEIKCEPSPVSADYAGVYLKRKGRNISELRISGSAIANGPCGLKDVDIHEWLCKTGKTFVDEIKEYQILVVTSIDVMDQKLTTSWKNLRRVHQ
jgi:hypothetical protein